MVEELLILMKKLYYSVCNMLNAVKRRSSTCPCAKRAVVAGSTAAGGYEGSLGAALLNICVINRQSRVPPVTAACIRQGTLSDMKSL